MIEAEHVHHIFPREQYPEYQYERWNLMSLCFNCHNGMHNRFNGELSKAGRIQMQTTALMNGIDIRSHKQTILVIGLRGCGKSTYVKQHLDGDSMAYDLDAIASAFRLKMPHEEYYKPARNMANDFLAGFINKAHDYVDTLYIIRTAPPIKELEQIAPDKVVICKTMYEYRNMNDRASAQRRIDDAEKFCTAQGVAVEIIAPHP